MEHARTKDAVIFVPGLMGSELVDEGGKIAWGLSPGALARALASGEAMRRLNPVTGPPLVPGRLLSAPAMLPLLTRVEPYGPMVRALREAVVAHPGAFLAFPYDWRLSIADSAKLLGTEAERHVEAWQRSDPGRRGAKLVLVCHSMGGLVARYFTEVLAGREITRLIVTLGTPHYGSLRAVLALANGRVLRFGLLAERVRSLARSLPAIYELLPRYRCLDGIGGLWPLTSSQVSDLGADRDSAEAATSVHDQLDAAIARNGRDACPVRALVGVAQPTAQSFTLDAGEPVFHQHVGGEDRQGDGTVYRDAAAPTGDKHGYLPQRHGRIACTSESVAYVHAVLTERPQGPPMGVEIGVDLPDVVVPGEAFDATILADPRERVRCTVSDAQTGRQIAVAPCLLQDGVQGARISLPQPGLYSVDVKGGGFNAVGDLVLAADPSE